MFPPFVLTPSPEALAHLASVSDMESAIQHDILTARDYHVGAQFVALTDRLRMFLGGNSSDSMRDADRLRLNICRIVTNAVTERLFVRGFETDEVGTPGEAPNGTPQTVKPLAAWAWQVWQKNKMDSKQRAVHLAACRDGEAFVIVDWDGRVGRPRFTPHERFVDTSLANRLTTPDTAAHIGEGCRAFYRNDDPDQDLLFVTKQWVEVMYPAGLRRERRRLTVYYPDRIEKYAGRPGAWQRTMDEGDAGWPIRWVDTRGAPLGCPVAHFRSTAGMEAAEAWPLQNAINKELVDLLAASDMTAFRLILAFGWQPVDSDGNPLTIEAGTILGTTNPQGSAQVIDGADLSNIITVIDSLIIKAALATDTPTDRFIATRQIRSEGSQKEGQEPLVNKVRARQSDLGDGWERCLEVARRLENTFGRGGLDEGVLLQAQWEPAQSRDEDAELAQAAKKQSLGIPARQIWKELGYDDALIAVWEAERQAQEQADRAAQQQGALVFNGRQG